MNKILLYVSAQQASAVLWRSGKLLSCLDFSNDRDGWTEFSSLLLSYPRLPLYMLVDAVDEDYRNETLPHTLGGTRRAMLARKLRQLFRSTPYRAVWLQGREPGNRRDDRYLFMAMTNPDLLRPWLDIVQTRQAPLAGIYLLPMVSQQLLGSLRLNAPKLLLVSQQSGGLRQSFFHDRTLKISRLTPLETQGDSTMTPYTEEIEKTRFYLNSLRLITRDERLAVCVLDPRGSLEALCLELARDPNLQYLPLDQRMANRRLGLTPAILATCSNVLHLAMLGARAPAISLAPPALTRGFRHHQARLALWGLAAATLLGAVIWGGANYYLAGVARQQSTRLAAQAKEQNALYRAAAKHFPDAPTSAQRMVAAVELAQRIRQERGTPERLMNVLSRALDSHPSIRLDRFQWQAGAAGPLPGAGRGPAALSQNAQIGYIEAQISPFHGNYRAALADARAFAEGLRGDPSVAQVSFLELPLNIAPDARLAGTTAAGHSAATSATFKLKLILKPHN